MHTDQVTGISMPWRLFLACSAVGVVGGAIVGVVRGSNYLPTLPFAVIEGAFLIGIPSAVLGLVLAGVWSLGTTVHRHTR